MSKRTDEYPSPDVSDDGPPYFRLNHETYRHHLERGLKITSELSLTEVSDRFGTIGDLYQHYRNHRVRVSSNPDHKNLFLSPDPFVQDRLAFKQAFTEVMDEACLGMIFLYDVGSVRSHYYMQLAALPEDDYSATSGFPEYFVLQNGHSGNPVDTSRTAHTNVLHWIAYDQFLGEQLNHFGLTWSEVEDTLVKVFYKNLPLFFQKVLALEPDPMMFAAWSNEIEMWVTLAQKPAITRTDAIRTAVNEVIKRAEYDPFLAEYMPPVKILLSEVSGIPYYEYDGLVRTMNSYLNVKDSPILTAMYNTLTDVFVAKLTDWSFDPSPSLPNYAEKIVMKLRGYDENKFEYPDALWSLIADLAFHLPIVCGVPRVAFKTASDPMNSKLLPHRRAAIKQRVLRSNKARQNTV